MYHTPTFLSWNISSTYVWMELDIENGIGYVQLNLKKLMELSSLDIIMVKKSHLA